MERILWEYKDKIRRQSPGSDKYTMLMIEKLKEIIKRDADIDENKKLNVLNIAPGCGYETLVLAKNLKADIIALDASETFLNKLVKLKELEAIDTNITLMTEDMDDIPLKNDSQDLIWCEGAINILGLKKAIRLWRRLLKNTGYLVVSDYTLKSDYNYDEIIDEIEEFYPEINTLEANIKCAEKHSYKVVDTYVAEDDIWTCEFIDPILKAAAELKEKFSANKSYTKYLDELLSEVNTIIKYRKEIDFVFYILKIK